MEKGKKIIVEYDDKEWLYIPDVKYVEYDGIFRSMQLIVPYKSEWNQDEYFPVIMFIPGSAWYKQEMYNSIPNYSKLASLGYVIAVVQYRESTIAKYPAQVDDIEAAINLLIERSNEYHIDINKIYLGGNSSGGHIALMSALRNSAGLMNKTYKIEGVIAESAPTDILLCAEERLPEWLPDDFKPTKDLLGVDDVTENIELAKEASCSKYISEDIKLPRILLLHGIDDDQVDVEHSRRLYELIKKTKNKVKLYELEGVGHGGQAFWSKNVLEIIEDFISGKS